MGTSTSYRAPAIPRWQAFTTALQTRAPLERIISELFNAGAQWEEVLASSAIAAFAVAFVQARETLPERLFLAERPEWVLQEYVTEAREASVREGGLSSALPLGERALTAALARTASGQASLAEQSPSSMALNLSALGPPSDAAVSYLGELMNQFARHIVSRETGRLTEKPSAASLSGARETTRNIATQAQALGERMVTSFADVGAVREGWSELVHEVFRRGRRLPVESQ